jgi:hypothetical protein
MRRSSQSPSPDQGLLMLFYRAVLPLSRKTLVFVAGTIRRHRASIGSVWRKLNPTSFVSKGPRWCAARTSYLPLVVRSLKPPQRTSGWCAAAADREAGPAVPLPVSTNRQTSLGVAAVSRRLPFPAGLVSKSVSRCALWPADSESCACAQAPSWMSPEVARASQISVQPRHRRGGSGRRGRRPGWCRRCRPPAMEQ